MQSRLYLSGLLMCFWAVCFDGCPASAEYWNPRPYNATYIFELEPNPATIDRVKDLKVWVPLPREWDSQKAVTIVSIDPPPLATFVDPVFGNRIAFWDFGAVPTQAVYTAAIKFRLEAYDMRAEVEPAQVGIYDKTSQDYQLYTRNESTICVTPKVRTLAKEAIGAETNAYLQAKRIVKYVTKKVRYKIFLDRDRSVQSLFDHALKDTRTGEEYYEGCCNERSALIAALCRAVGIPARSVVGFVGWDPWSSLKPQFEFETTVLRAGLAGAQHWGQSMLICGPSILFQTMGGFRKIRCSRVDPTTSG